MFVMTAPFSFSEAHKLTECFGVDPAYVAGSVLLREEPDEEEDVEEEHDGGEEDDDGDEGYSEWRLGDHTFNFQYPLNGAR